jgi:hypothetical protein
VSGRQRDRRDGERDNGGRISSRGSSYARWLRRHFLKLAKVDKVDRVELHKDFGADTDGTGGSRRADFTASAASPPLRSRQLS